MLLPSGDHSKAPATPSAVSVSARGAEPSMGMAMTCGASWSMPRSESVVLSGDQRRCGRGIGLLTMRTDAPRRFGAPPDDGTT